MRETEGLIEPMMIGLTDRLNLFLEQKFLINMTSLVIRGRNIKRKTNKLKMSKKKDGNSGFLMALLRPDLSLPSLIVR